MLLRSRPELQVHAPPRLLFQAASRDIGIEQEGVQHDVVVEAARFDSEPRQFERGAFHVAGDLHGTRILQPWRELRRNARHARRAPRRYARKDRWYRAQTRLPPISKSPPPRARPAPPPARRAIRRPLAIDAVLALARIFAGAEFLEQTVELHLLIDGLEQHGVGGLRLDRFDGELHRHIGGDGGETLAHADALDVVLQALAVGLLFDFGGALEHGVERTEALDQVPGALVADSRRARNVVHGVALEGQKIGHLVGPHAQEGLHLFGVVPFVVLGGIEHFDVVVHQLQHVLVAGNDHHVHACRFGAACQSADDIVGFEARKLENGNPHGFENAPHERNLVEQIGRGLDAIGLVFGELLHAMRGFAALENRGDVGGRVLLRQLAQHVVEDVDRFGGEPGAGPHGRSGGAGARVVGAKDKAEGYR